ncbi:hypothetical protein [Flammeovirga sp. OC4]|uniref:hypothetical protein n=1 Tax=Flammeovirga sp. OC4 TaxID=1382345 RepID=UPI0005C71BDB|nr:hypothetical protein [Flammeovirga sp. OC4]
MFWNRKPKCPISTEDKKWVEEMLDWVNINFIDIIEQPMILPTNRFFNIKFEATQECAKELFENICMYFQVNPYHISIEFYDNRTTVLDHTVSIQNDEDGHVGLFSMDGESNMILIERGLLNNPQALIATIAHELCHYIIMEEKGYYFEEYENELRTDLTAIAYGFGLFLGNTKFNFNQWSSGGMQGWSSSSQGYLPQKVIAYAMAEICMRKRDLEPEVLQYANKSFKKDLQKSLKYLKSIYSINR